MNARTPGPHPHPAVRQWLTWYSAGDVSPGTTRLRRTYIDNLITALPGDLLDAGTANLAAWIDHPRWGTEARRSARSTARSFYGWAHREDLIDKDPTTNLRSIRPATRIPRPIPEHALTVALARASAEQRTMLLLGAYAGLRRSEIAAVHTDNVTDLGLMIRGKGRTVRRVPIHGLLAPHLAAATPGWLFPSPRNDGAHVHPTYVRDRLAEVLPAPWTPHSLRHRAATQWYRSCKDITIVQRLLGHAKVETTMLYVLVDDDRLEDAVRGIA